MTVFSTDKLVKKIFKIILTIIFLLTTNDWAWGQIVLSGRISTTQGEQLPGALIEFRSSHQADLSQVITANEQGEFVTTLSWPGDSLVLSVRALGFQERVIRLPNRPQSVRLALGYSLTQLKEVVVKAAPIRREGDTLSYRVAAFSEQKDRVIADVLKKLPGVEVEANGRILYEGRPIQKFYIDGADLLEGRYNLASNNLPAEAVQEVQVLKRHQPITALRGVQQSEQASLNISLKKKITATGQAQAGTGIAPKLWQINLSPMLFTPRQQLLDTYQTNNTGHNLADELASLGLDDLQRLGEPGLRKPDLTSIQDLGAPPLSNNRWLLNQAHLLSANHLFPCGKETSLRLNSSYLTDVQTRQGNTFTRFTLPTGQTVSLTEDQHNYLRFRQLTADLAYIRNKQERYAKNVLSVAKHWDEQVGQLTRSGDVGYVSQRAYHPFGSLSNRLGVVQPISGGRLFQFNSVFTLANSPQKLVVEPGPLPVILNNGQPYAQATQQAQQRTFYAANSATLEWSHARWHYAAMVGTTHETQHLASVLRGQHRSTASVDSLQNQLRAYQARYFIQPTLTYKSDRWNLEVEAPVNYRVMRALDAPLAIAQHYHWLTVEPQLTARYELNGLWHTKAGADLQNTAGSLEQLLFGYLLRDYRTLQRNAAPFIRERTANSRLGLYYENPLTSWFSQATYSLQLITRNQLLQSVVRPDGSVTTIAVARRAPVSSHTFMAQASKFISPWKATFTLQLRGSSNQQAELINDVLTSACSQQGAMRILANATPTTWFSLTYSGQATLVSSQVGLARQPHTYLLEHRGNMAFYPAEGHQLLFDAEYLRNEGTGPAIRAAFLDAAYRYTLPTARKLEATVQISNLLNAPTYQYSNLSAFALVQNTYVLRPRQLLLSFRASF